MDFDQEEKDIQQFFKKHAFKKPPESMMKNYEDEVKRKIMASRGLPFGGGVVMSVSLFFLAAGILAFVWYAEILQPHKQPVVIPVTSTVLNQRLLNQEKKETPQNMPDKQIQNEDKVSAKMTDDLLVLEILGEDEGLLADYDSVGPDIDFLPQTPL